MRCGGLTGHICQGVQLLDSRLQARALKLQGGHLLHQLADSCDALVECLGIELQYVVAHQVAHGTNWTVGDGLAPGLGSVLRFVPGDALAPSEAPVQSA
ncbi:hypothetical protein D9M68_667200 [compost metagenome]